MQRSFVFGYLGMFIGMCCAFWSESIRSETVEQVYEWAVIGGGPAGVIMGFILEEAQVKSADVCWIDPEFAVGRMGKYYATVPANAKAKHFVDFLSMCSAFAQVQTPAVETLKRLDPEKEYELKYIVDVLQDMSDYLLQRVASVRGSVTRLDFVDDIWHVSIGDRKISAKRVVLAIGGHPRTLGYLRDREIPLDHALNKEVLARLVTDQDTVAVVGGAHSAVLVMKFLCEVGVGRVINFYRTPLSYGEQHKALERGCEIQGWPLSGMAADWAAHVLDAHPPINLIRFKSSLEALHTWLPICTKIVYALGFERNELPEITGVCIGEHDGTTGVISEHLFGFGIAFPELIDDGAGYCKPGIGLREFVQFVKRVLPLWMTRSTDDAWLDKYSDLFSVTAFK